MEPGRLHSGISSVFSDLSLALSSGVKEISSIYDEFKYEAYNSLFDRRRSLRRIEKAKRKARPELNIFGWDRLNLASQFTLPDFADSIRRVNGNNMSVAEFRQKFEYPSEPCILTSLTDHWKASEKWTVKRILKKYRNQKFKCGEDDDGYSVKIKCKYYIGEVMLKENRDDSPLYIFDSGFGSRHKTKKLLDDYEVPVMFKDDLFNYADFKKRPPHRWFVMGPARSGTGIHIDPLGTSAWNSLIQGHKRWVLISPNAPKHLVKPTNSEKGKHPQEAVTWFNTVYKRVRDSSWPKEYRVIEARQGPGETMFVPSGWWHVVINEDSTIAVTQNFASVANLHQVWPKTVVGRPKLSKHWLYKERPELIPIIHESLKSPPDPNDSSSDSSSSSSSSSDSSSEEDGGSMMSRKKRRSENGHDVCVNKLRSTPPV